MNWKRIYPHISYRLRTYLTLDDVHRRLWENAIYKSEVPWYNFEIAPSYYITVHDDRFEVEVSQTWRRAQLPVVSGNISVEEDTVYLDVSMELPKVTKVFLTIWLTIVSLFFISSVASVLRSIITGAFGTKYLLFLVPAAGFLIGYLLLNQMFGVNCSGCRRYLAGVLEGREESVKGEFSIRY